MMVNEMLVWQDELVTKRQPLKPTHKWRHAHTKSKRASTTRSDTTTIITWAFVRKKQMKIFSMFFPEPGQVLKIMYLSLLGIKKIKYLLGTGGSLTLGGGGFRVHGTGGYYKNLVVVKPLPPLSLVLSGVVNTSCHPPAPPPLVLCPLTKP